MGLPLLYLHTRLQEFTIVQNLIIHKALNLVTVLFEMIVAVT